MTIKSGGAIRRRQGHLRTHSKRLAGLATIVAILATRAAFASPMISTQLESAGSAPFSLVSFGSAATAGKQTTAQTITAAGETFHFTGTSGVYAGNVPGLVRSPFAPGVMGDYLAAEPGGALQIDFAQPQTSFDLLWGSVDTYNAISFGTGTQTITGPEIAMIMADTHFGLSNVAMEITGLAPFSSITVTSTAPAFEFVPGIPVPEPTTGAIISVGLIGLGLYRRKRAPLPTGDGLAPVAENATPALLQERARNHTL